MQILLNQFEEYINEAILERGFSYFKNGYVHELEVISPGEYEAIVEGTQAYVVRLTIKGGIITEQICDCPYDQGPVCKHIAAVIYYLHNEELDLNKNAKKGKTREKPKPQKRKTVTEQVDELLDKASHKE